MQERIFLIDAGTKIINKPRLLSYIFPLSDHNFFPNFERSRERSKVSVNK